ncbi:dihydrolipoyl dehydrogenase [Parabacteroides sp. OttesenSCG-928-G06]|nr:dihydrolipoyl dehydrogenase [Parabacteroides sp. OttesenSCG-928-G06]
MKYDVAIIGGGPAGYTAAERAAHEGLTTILFEKNALGGVCLNEGCIPTKTLLYSAKTYDNIKSAGKYGVGAENPSFDPAKIIARKNKVVKKLTAGIRMKLKEGGVEMVSGEAVIQGREEDGTIRITCGEETYEAAHLLLCTGSEAIIPPVKGLDQVEYWTSREALQAKELPASLVIVGGGVIGMEFASYFNSLGVKVQVVEMLDKCLGPMDRELSDMLQAEYTKKGIQFFLSHKVVEIKGNEVVLEKEGETVVLEGEKILLSVGRRPVTKGFGLEALQVEPFRNGIKVNEYMQTSLPNVYACGDITGYSLLAHTAVSEAEVAVRHIAGKEQKGMSYKAIPGVVYTNPEIAGVGATEEELQASGIPCKVKKIPMAFSGRFVAENEMGNGVCKLILAEDDTILGAHMLGNPSSELIIIAGIAIEKGMKAEEFGSFTFPHPTVGEILKEVVFS